MVPCVMQWRAVSAPRPSPRHEACSSPRRAAFGRPLGRTHHASREVMPPTVRLAGVGARMTRNTPAVSSRANPSPFSYPFSWSNLTPSLGKLLTPSLLGREARASARRRGGAYQDSRAPDCRDIDSTHLYSPYRMERIVSWPRSVPCAEIAHRALVLRLSTHVEKRNTV